MNRAIKPLFLSLVCLSSFLWAQEESLAEKSTLPNPSPKPPFSVVVSSLIEHLSEEELLNLEPDILSLEIYYRYPLNLGDITISEFEAFFFLSEAEKQILLKAGEAVRENKKISLSKIEADLGENNYRLINYFIDFALSQKREKADGSGRPQTKVNYRLGIKNNQIEQGDFTRIAEGDNYQIRLDTLGSYLAEAVSFNYYFLLEKDRLEDNFPQFFKMSFSFSLNEKVSFFYGALSIDINQNLLFSTKNNSFSSFLPERGGFRSKSAINMSQSRSEVYFNGLGVRGEVENLNFFLWGGNYNYHINPTNLDPLYPDLRYATTINFNEEINFSILKASEENEGLQEKIIGLYLEYLFTNFKLSGGFLASSFNYPIINNVPEPEKIYGQNSFGISLGWDYLSPYFIWYGEFSSFIKEIHEGNVYSPYSKKLYAPAVVTGIRLWEEDLFGTLVIRFLDKDYNALHNNYYTAFSDKKNELGIYSALSTKLDSIRIRLVLDYADRIYASREFLFTSQFKVDWTSLVGYYLKIELFLKNNLDLNQFKIIVINGYKGKISLGKWEIFWKNHFVLVSRLFNLLSEINLKLYFNPVYSTTFRVGWGRESDTTFSLLFYYNSLFLDFIHLNNDSLWITTQNTFSLLDNLKLNFSLGTIWRTQDDKNYLSPELENDFFFSALLSGELGN